RASDAFAQMIAGEKASSRRASGVRTGAVPIAVGSSTQGMAAAVAASTVAGIAAAASVLKVPRLITRASASVVRYGVSARVSVMSGRAPLASRPSATSPMETAAVMQWTSGWRSRTRAMIARAECGADRVSFAGIGGLLPTLVDDGPRDVVDVPVDIGGREARAA